MRQFQTSVVEQRREFTEELTTHPSETAWASEAIFFIHVEKVKGKNPVLKPKVQISPDGVHWIDEGTVFEPISNEGRYFVKVNHFGGWLRLQGDIEGKDVSLKLTVHLVLKE